jgi:hypothetical protein
MNRRSRLSAAPALPAAAAVLFAALAVPAASLDAQAPGRGGGDAPVQRPLPTPRGSANIQVLGHVPLGGPFTVSDIELEQELSRPYAYVSRMFGQAGFDVVDLSDPDHPSIIHRWRIENAELHRGTGAMDVKYFISEGDYYVVQSVQFQQGGPDANLGAVVFDVSDLPDDPPEEVARITYPESPGGFHNIFMYKHSDGRPLLFATTTGEVTNVYDMKRVVEGEDSTLVARIPVPDNPIGEAMGFDGYHDFYVGYHPESGQDRYYGGGAGGYYVWDVTDLQDMELVASVTGVAGLNWGHTITPTPDGRYFVGETEYQYAPLRIFDLKPALDGDQQSVSRVTSAWTPDWRNLAHNHEMRWPYVFVSAYEDGLQVFNMMDAENPFTVAYFDTYPGPHKTGMCGDNICNGAFGVDVRNADGLIVVSDMATGFWAFRMDGFEGWNGLGWGVPDISSAQDWRNGPRGHGMQGGGAPVGMED